MTWTQKAIAAAKKMTLQLDQRWKSYCLIRAFTHCFGIAGRIFISKKLFLLARLTSQFWRFLTGIEIHPWCSDWRRGFIDHGMGVVIGETAIIEDDVVLFHGVTLGGTGKEKRKRHPTIKKGAFISAHAQILGPVTIGESARIGASAVVLSDIPNEATAVGIPAKVVRIKGKKVSQDDQNL